MKYFPLIWAALWRKPARMILTLLSVSMAFTLFGMMIGFDASVQQLVKASRLDRIYIYPRFGGTLPLAFKDQILRLPGVRKIAYRGMVAGYYRDRKNGVYAYMIDPGWLDVMTEYPLSRAERGELAASPSNAVVSRQFAARYHLKAGDVLPVQVAGGTRADGGKFWPFTVVSITGDIAQEPAGYIIGNYNYLDQTRPADQRGTADIMDILVADPARAGDTAKAIDAMFANSAAATESHVDRIEAENGARAGINIPFVTMVVAGAGLFMILFLTANGIAQSVRERIGEFAMLKTLGFADGLVMALVFVEAAIPCLAGAILGLGLAAAFAQAVPGLVPPELYLPVPTLSAQVQLLALGCALLVAFLSSVIPVLRLKRLDVAAALTGK